MPWCCEDEASPASEEILGWAIQGAELHVPALWIWEILNVLTVTVKRGRISADRAKEFLEQIGTFNIRIASPPGIADVRVCRRWRNVTGSRPTMWHTWTWQRLFRCCLRHKTAISAKPPWRPASKS